MSLVIAGSITSTLNQLILRDILAVLRVHLPVELKAVLVIDHRGLHCQQGPDDEVLGGKDGAGKTLSRIFYPLALNGKSMPQSKIFLLPDFGTNAEYTEHCFQKHIGFRAGPRPVERQHLVLRSTSVAGAAQ
eukprot:scaffold167860_cov19-Tisochrysis_lutea.AAC.1